MSERPSIDDLRRREQGHVDPDQFRDPDGDPRAWMENQDSDLLLDLLYTMVPHSDNEKRQKAGRAVKILKRRHCDPTPTDEAQS